MTHLAILREHRLVTDRQLDIHEAMVYITLASAPPFTMGAGN